MGLPCLELPGSLLLLLFGLIPPFFPIGDPGFFPFACILQMLDCVCFKTLQITFPNLSPYCFFPMVSHFPWVGKFQSPAPIASASQLPSIHSSRKLTLCATDTVASQPQVGQMLAPATGVCSPTSWLHSDGF